jgi:three-Cys-motif partner protein
MSTQKKFYHPDTEKKLKALEGYLRSYLDVMSKQKFETIYIDAFAGSGELPEPATTGLFGDEVDSDEFVRGSALRALEAERKFSKYIFIEKDKAKLSELQHRVSEVSNVKDRVQFIQGDASQELMKLCPHLSKMNVRALVFLDPFGNQVGWELLDALAKTKHIDLWYLFPAMLGVYRQIGNLNAKMDDDKIASLDKLFGQNDWRTAFIERKSVDDLFGTTEVSEKIADVEDITRFKIKCLKSIFEGGVSDKWLPLGRAGSHWYSLIFAMANPSPPAVKAGHSIANHIMTRS